MKGGVQVGVKLINSRGEELILPFQFSWTDIPRTINVPRSEMATGDGTRRAGKETVEEFSFTVEGTIWDIDRSENIDQRDSIADFIQYTPIRVYQLPNDDRFVYAHVQDFDQNWQDERTQLDLNIVFAALDPFFYGEQQMQENVISLNEENGYSRELTVESEGNRVNFPVIELTITTSGEGFTVQNLENGSNFEYEGELTSGDLLIIDCDSAEVSVNNENKLNNANVEFLVNSFFLNPDGNTLLFESESEIEFESEIKYQARWF